jgi:hypothetical protein
MLVLTKVPSDCSTVGEKLLQTLPQGLEVERVYQDNPHLLGFLSLEVDGGIANAIAIVKHVLARQARVSVVLATAPKFHNFVAGYFLKKILGVKLVLDYRDEWSLCPFDFVEKGQLNTWWEQRCLRASDLVVFTTPGTRQHTLDVFNELEPSRTRVVENGAEAADDEFNGHSAILDFLERDSRYTITAAGVLAGHTDPASFLGTLNAVLERRPDLQQNVRVLWIGRKASAQVRTLVEMDRFGVCVSFDQVSQAEARAVMKRSDLLLLLVDPQTDRCRPGRLYTYLASERPLLVFGGVGESGNVVRQVRAGYALEAGDDKALEAIFSNEAHSTVWNTDERRCWIERRTRERLAEELFHHLSTLAQA